MAGVLLLLAGSGFDLGPGAALALSRRGGEGGGAEGQIKLGSVRTQ